MNNKSQHIQSQILQHCLENVPFDGWRWDVVETATVKAGFDRNIALAVFPDKLSSVLQCFSEWADEQMLNSLKEIQIENMRVRDRIRLAIKTRLKILEPHKESVRAASVYWLSPFRKFKAGQIIWTTADKIWIWAGDTATDYNHYSKRALLSGVIGTTTVQWLNDQSEQHVETSAFLDRRIDNVLSVGKLAGKVLGSFKKRSKT